MPAMELLQGVVCDSPVRVLFGLFFWLWKDFLKIDYKKIHKNKKSNKNTINKN